MRGISHVDLCYAYPLLPFSFDTSCGSSDGDSSNKYLVDMRSSLAKSNEVMPKGKRLYIH